MMAALNVSDETATVGLIVVGLLFLAQGATHVIGIYKFFKKKGVEAALRLEFEEFKTKIMGKISELADSLGVMRLERKQDMDVLRSELLLQPLNENMKRNVDPYRILLIDDDRVYQDLFKRMICPLFKLDLASSLGQAARMMKEKEYDCVILDLGLPDASLKDPMKQFREKHPTALCLVLSGSDDPEMIRLAMQHGAAAYLIKNRDDLDARDMSRMIRDAIVINRSKPNKT